MSARSVAVMVAAGVVLGCSLLHAERKPKAAPDAGADREVTDLLRREAASPLDRRAALASLLKRVPDSAVARWQSGFIKTEKSWRSFDAPLDPKQAALLAEYGNRRSDAPQTVRGQLSLAKWCEANALADAATAHRTVALSLANSDEQPQILKSLGYANIGDEWLSPNEVRDWKRAGQNAEKSFKIWGPRIEQIVLQLQGNSKRRETALAALREIRDPAAIPALERYFAHDEPRLLVKTLAAIPAYEASLSLARMAVLFSAADVRRLATESLVHRRREDFVPPSIQMLSTPIRYQATVAGGPEKSEFLQRRAVQETHNRIRIWTSSSAYIPILVRPNRIESIDHLNPNDLTAGRQAFGAAIRSIDDEVYAGERLVATRNDAVEELNGRVSSLLASISGREQSTDPHDWWNWWAEDSGVQPGTKIVEEETEARVYHPAVFTLRLISCFQAGTPVWTESGMKPIEEIRIGDRVLTQNVESGELALKPVLQTSVRAPHQLVQITAGGESITCTDGHRFWVAGEAWTKARDLTPKHLLHTARGTIPVESVSQAGVDRTFNLVVADFHSYFVGKQALLVQDLPLPRSTNCVVPGLQPEW